LEGTASLLTTQAAELQYKLLEKEKEADGNVWLAKRAVDERERRLAQKEEEWDLES